MVRIGLASNSSISQAAGVSTAAASVDMAAVILAAEDWSWCKCPKWPKKDCSKIFAKGNYKSKAKFRHVWKQVQEVIANSSSVVWPA
jgi:hypothetical protein